MKKVIEPSEILIDGDGTIKNEPIRANPWIRFLARMFDYSLLFWGISALHRVFVFPKATDVVVPFEYLFWIPIETLLLFGLGTTPGKWFLSTTVRQGKRARLEFLSALQRSFHVWFRGLGLGIPIINAICMLVAYQRLKVFQLTSWDRDDHIQITHHPIGQWRLVIAAIFSSISFLFHWAV